MNKYEYVSKREYMLVKKNLESIIRKAIRIMENKYGLYGITYELIGSGEKHLVTRIKGGNKGFDLDFNIIIPSIEENEYYIPKEIIKEFMDAFNMTCENTPYEYPKNKTSVIKLKKVDKENSKIEYSGDFAIIYYDSNYDNGYYILKHLDDGNYKFEKRNSSINIENKLNKILKYTNGWNWIREEYLKLKNNNKNKESRVLYLESIHNIYNQINQDELKENENYKVKETILDRFNYIAKNYSNTNLF